MPGQPESRPNYQAENRTGTGIPPIESGIASADQSSRTQASIKIEFFRPGHRHGTGEAYVRGHHRIQLILCVVLSSIYSFAGTAFKATTTLTVETSNNTSAANTFTSQTNGNTGAGNVSKLPLRNLLYSGSTAKTYTNFLPWFGFGDHMAVGYTSNDPAQVQR